MKKIIIFLGAPGSGKGTQAKNLAMKHGFYHLSTGDLLRAMMKKADLTPEEKQNIENIKNGQLVSDELIYKLAFAALLPILKSDQGVVLDGAIRTLAQAREYQKFFESEKVSDEVLAMEVAITDEESFKRLAGRRTAEGRADDSPEVVMKRVAVQGNKSIAPLREYYDSLGILRAIDGMKSIEEVSKEIEKYVV